MASKAEATVLFKKACIALRRSGSQNNEAPLPSKTNPSGEYLTDIFPDVTSDQLSDSRKKKSELEDR